MSTYIDRLADRRRVTRHARAVQRAMSSVHSRAVRNEFLSLIGR